MEYESNVRSFMMSSGEILPSHQPRDYKEIAKLITEELLQNNYYGYHVGLICNRNTRDQIINQIFLDTNALPDMKFNKTFIKTYLGNNLIWNSNEQNFKGLVLRSCFVFDRNQKEVMDIKILFAPCIYGNFSTKIIYEERDDSNELYR